MMLRIFLLTATLLTAAYGEQSIDLNTYESLLQEAAMDVLHQHVDDMSSEIYPPPLFQVPPDLMRSFVPNTGIGNREELIIDSIQNIPAFFDSDFSSFRYQRFNNTDFILAYSKNEVVLNRIDGSLGHFSFSRYESALYFASNDQNAVSDAILFTRFPKRAAILYVAILTQTWRSGGINVYEVLGDKSVPATFIELNADLYARKYTIKKIAYIHSQYGESLVVLVDSPDDKKIVYRQQGNNELNHYIEVHYPGAVDLVTFTVHSHGYIAVASSTTCEIYKLIEFAKNHILFDSLTFFSANLVDIEYFRLGYNHYLALAGPNEQYLYGWKSGEFALKQQLHDTGVSQIFSATLPTCRDDVILLSIQVNAVEVYVYNGKKEEFVKATLAVQPNFSIVPNTITSFTLRNRAALLYRDFRGELAVSVIDTKMEAVPNPILEAGRQLSLRMSEIQRTLDNQTKQIEKMKEVLSNAVRKSGDQIISSFQTFEQLQTTQEAEVSEMRKPPVYVQWEGNSLTLEEYNRGTRHLLDSIENLEKMLVDIENIIPDIVRTDESAIITGPKKFEANIKASSLSAHSVNIQSVAGIDLPQLQNNVYRLDKPKKIEGTITFSEPLTITGNFDIDTTLNDIDISEDVMTTDTKQLSYADMVFKNSLEVSGSLFISGHLNGIDIEKDIVTVTGSHYITGKKHFLGGLYAGNVVTQSLDGLDLEDVYKKALLKTGSQEVPGTKTFSGSLLTGNIELSGLLNGYNVSDLAENIVRIDTPTHVTGHKTFSEDVTVNGDVTVEGTVNGLHIPGDLFLTDVSQSIDGKKEFTGTVTAEHVTVTGTVDGLKIPEDIVTLSGDEEIPGTLYFTNGINVLNDMVVEGLVDGVNIDEVVKEALKLNETTGFQNAVFEGPVTIAGNLEVLGTVNNINLNDLFKDIVFKNDKNIVIESQKMFKRVQADAVKVKTINGYNFPEDFMTVAGDQEISGTKTFTKPVSFKDVIVGDNHIGNLDVVQLYQNKGDLVIEDTLDLEFADEIIVEGDLIIQGKMNGLKVPEDFVQKKSSDKPIANKNFVGKVNVENLVVYGVANVSGTFGGVDLNKFYNDRLTISTTQEIDGDLWIANSSVSDLEVTGLVNGKDFVEFSRNIMSKTRPQVVTGEKEFKGKTTVHGPITTEGGVNGIYLADLNNRAFKLRGDNLVSAPMEFEDIIVHEMTVTGLINGVDLKELAEDSLKKKADVQYLTGVNVFERGFHVQGDILADTVNDLLIPRDILLSSIPQTITGKFTFGNMFVSGDMRVDGLVNGLDLSETVPRLARTDHEETINTNLTFLAPIHVFHDIEVTGKVNDMDFKDIFKDLLMQTGDQNVAGHKILRGSVTVGSNVEVEYINGIKWRDFLADLVWIDSPQEIRSSKTFTDDTEIGELLAGSLQVGLMNGINLSDFINDAVFVDEPANITGVKTFRKNAVIDGTLDAALINNLDLKRDVITCTCNDGPQVITGAKTFMDLTVYDDILVKGKVNSYDLNDLYKDTLLTVGNQNVTGKKTLQSKVTFKGNVHARSVNDVDLQELVTIDTEQTLEGPIYFSDDIEIDGNLIVTGLINEVNMTELVEDAVYLDSDSTIEGQYSLDTAIVTGDLAVDGHVNGLKLPEFDRDVNQMWDQTNQTYTALDKDFLEHCETVKYLQDLLEQSYYILDGFAVHQTLEYPASYIHLVSPEQFTLVYMNGEASTTAVPYTWNRDTEIFELSSQNNFHEGSARSVVRYFESKEIRLNIGISEDDSYISINGEHSELPKGLTDGSILSRQTDILIALLFSVRGVVELFTVVDSSNLIAPYGSIDVGKEVSSITLYIVGGTTFMAVARFYPPPYVHGYCLIYGEIEKNWQQVQSINVAASTHVKHVIFHNYHYLIFISVASMHETKEPKSIQVYRNSSPNEILFSLFQKLPFEHAKGLQAFHFGDLSELYLTTWNQTKVQTYRLEGESGFQTVYTLNGKCIKDVKALSLSGDVYLAVGQQNEAGETPLTSVLYKGLTKGTKYISHALKNC